MKFFIVVDSNAQPIYHNHSDKLVCHPLWAAHQFFSHNFQEALTSVTCVDGTRFALEKVRAPKSKDPQGGLETQTFRSHLSPVFFIHVVLSSN